MPEYDAAIDYDRQKKIWGWHGPEVVFGLIYECISPGQSVLDIGIGTGLGSALFHKAGLRVHGMDISPAMLAVCEKKGFAEDLRIHDLTVSPYPYDAASFDHAVSVGVLNHFEDLSTVFAEAARVLKENGVFAFVVDDRKEDEAARFEVEHNGSQVALFRHSEALVNRYLRDTDFELLSKVEFRMAGHRPTDRPFHLVAYAARKKRD